MPGIAGQWSCPCREQLTTPQVTGCCGNQITCAEDGNRECGRWKEGRGVGGGKRGGGGEGCGRREGW